MPIYEHHCRDCRRHIDLFLRLRELDVEQRCDCGGVLERKISAPAIYGDYPGYASPATGRVNPTTGRWEGKWIEGRRAHQEDLKRSNCRLSEPGEMAAYERGKDARTKAFGDAVESIVEKTVTEIGHG